MIDSCLSVKVSRGTRQKWHQRRIWYWWWRRRF